MNITRADIDMVLAAHKDEGQEGQIAAVRTYLESNLPANPVVNGVLAQYMREENVGLIEVILDNLHSYSEWVGERPAE